MPKILKTPARTYGNTGVIHAVGPDGALNGELKPCPDAIEAAMLPVSPPYKKCWLPCTGSMRNRNKRYNKRISNAAVKIIQPDFRNLPKVSTTSLYLSFAIVQEIEPSGRA